MQRFILGQRKWIMLVSGLLIGAGFMAHWFFSSEPTFTILLMLASILGVLPIAIQAYQALKIRLVSIDVLVTLAVAGAFLIRNFEEAAIVTFLFLFGAFLEERTLSKTRSAIRQLTDMAPETALKKGADGLFTVVDVDQVDEGDEVLVKTGAKVPVDGTVLSGEGAMNEASITGESVPVAKAKGDLVYAGTILENGTLQMQADRVGEDTTFAKIIELVEEAQDSKSEAERFIDRFSKYYTPAVLFLSILVGLLTRDMETAIIILVLGCPGALVIGVPVSNVAGIGNGAKQGILLKGSEIIHNFSRVDTMVFDKTGTLTIGKPKVASMHLYPASAPSDPSDPSGPEEVDEASLLGYLRSVEEESDHPLAGAIVAHLADARRYPVSETDVIGGGGIVAQVDGHRLVVGSLELMEREVGELRAAVRRDADKALEAGLSLVLTALDGRVRILMAIGDELRPGVKESLEHLRRLGVKDLIVLSGDNQRTVDLVARDLGLNQARGHMLPKDKQDYIRQLVDEGRMVAFVGDGVNDSPSLALAPIGIAMGSGTDVAIETSDVVLMRSDFDRLPHALGLVKATARNMRQNIVIAVGVVLILLASVFFSDWMNMSIGMLAHEASILVVILNGMRLLTYRTRGL